MWVVSAGAADWVCVCTRLTDTGVVFVGVGATGGVVFVDTADTWLDSTGVADMGGVSADAACKIGAGQGSAGVADIDKWS